LNNSSATGDHYLIWQADDSISFFDGVSNIKCTLSSGVGSRNGTFIPEFTPETAPVYYAVYPYSSNATLVDGKLGLYIPDTLLFNSVSNLAESGINVMVAKQSSTDIHFKNLCSYLRFTITGTTEQIIREVVIEGKDGQAVAGKAEVTFSDEEPLLTFDSENSSSAICILFGEGKALSPEGLTFTAAVPPVFDNGFKATVFLTDGTRQVLSSETSIARNDIVIMPEFAFSATDVAKVGTVHYSRISEAFAAANSSDADVTITLLDNISTGDTLSINNKNAKITIDLAGKKLALTNTLSVFSQAEIMDSTDGFGIICNHNGTTILSDAGSRLTISGGTVTSSANESYTLHVTNGGKVVIEGDAHIVSQNYRTIYLFGTKAAQTNATLEIRGGWIRCAENCTCVLSSRTTSAAEHRVVYINITGGHFSHSGNDYDSSRRCIYRGYNDCTTSVSGGFFDTNDIYRYYSGQAHNYTASGCSISSTTMDYPSEYAAGYTYYVKRDNSKAALDQAVRTLFNKSGASNLVVLAYKGGTEVYSSTFGYRRTLATAKDTLEMHDIFRIASISKSFTGGAMMLMVDRGLVNLDDPVNDYLSRLPEGKKFTVVNPTYPDVPITVRMLLNHTSTIGGSNYSEENSFKNITYSKNKPGEVYSYSNMGCCLAGAVVEIASGQRFDAFVKENILDKIVMPHSGYDPEQIDTLSGPKFVYLYSASGITYYTKSAYSKLMTEEQEQNYVLGFNTGLVGPAGNLKSNAHELARWMRTLQLGGVSPDGVRVIPESLVYMMHNSSVEYSTGKYYGFYLWRNVNAIPGVLKCGHVGSAYGANTTMAYGMRAAGDGKAMPVIPGCPEDWGVITLASGNNNEGDLGDAVTKLLYDTILSQQ